MALIHLLSTRVIFALVVVLSLVRAGEYGTIVIQLKQRGVTEGRRITAFFAGFEHEAVTDMDKERAAIAKWFYNSFKLMQIQREFQWVEGKRVSSVYYFQFTEQGLNAVSE